jgi:hypothetical protein
MLSFLQNLFFPKHSAFVVQELDHLRKVVVVEDKHLGLRIEISAGDKPLKKAEIIGPYKLLLTYHDGSSIKKRILN